jgi:putative cell wall-binding protein
MTAGQAHVAQAVQAYRSQCDSESQPRNGPSGHIDINHGAATTASTDVTLNLPAVDECGRITSVRLSNDGSKWRTVDYSRELSWSLLDPVAGGSNKTGLRSVWAQWGDSQDNWSAVEKASIAFVPVRPNVELTYSISGTVTGPGSAPLENVWVYANADCCGDGAYTDSSGNYTITGLLADDYTVTFDDGNGTYLYGYYGSTGFTYDWDQAAAVTVVDADVTGISVELPLALHISGTVTGGGSPLDGILVSVAGASYSYTVSTDVDGTYSAPVPDETGDYTICLYDMNDTYLPGCYDGSVASGFTLYWDQATAVAVTTSDVTGIDAAMSSATIVSGTITFTGGAPAQDAYVNAWSVEGWSNSAWVQPDGTYALPLAPGTYWMSVESPDASHLNGFYSSYFATHFTTSQDAATFFTVGSTNITGRNIVIPTGKLLSGNVTDAGANPLEDTYVGIDFGEFRGQAFTDSDGDWELSVPPGSYTINYYPGDPYLYGYYSSSGFTIDYAAATPVVVTTGDVSGLDVELIAGLQIEGTVTDPGAAPAADIMVQASSDAYWGVGYTDENGDYTLFVQPGNYYVAFYDWHGEYLSGYYSDSGFTRNLALADQVAVSTTDVTGIDAQFIASPHIRGTVTPQIGVVVDAVSSSFIANSQTAPDGTYSMAVPAGSYRISFTDNVDYRAGFYSATGFTTNMASATLVAVSSSDVTGIDVTIPPNDRVERLSGTGRFATAAAISAATFYPGIGVAYIAYAYNFPDALAGAAAAGMRPGPVLLVNSTGPIDPATAAELTRLRPAEIVVLGSTSVISANVANQLIPYSETGVVTRLSGSNRFATAAAISAATFEPGVSVAYVAYAYNFPDALAGAAAAGSIRGPVLLANTTGALNPSTVAELQRLKPYRIVVLGSTGVISDSVKNSLIPYTQSGLVTRLSGSGRFATAAAISAATNAPTTRKVAYIAYAYNFPDALAGAAAAGWYRGPVLLVNTTGAIDASTAAELTRLKPYRIIVLGSSGVISNSVMTQLAAYATMSP